MARMDEFREEREMMKERSLGERLEYFWEYNKLNVIIALVAVISVVSIIYTVVTKEDIILEGVILNRYWTEMEGLGCDKIKSAYLEYRELDPEEYTISVNGALIYADPDVAELALESSEAVQIITSQALTASLDFITGDVESLMYFDEIEYLGDLRNYLTDEQIQAYSEYFVYSETHPSIPVILNVTGSKTLTEEYTRKNQELGICIIGNAPHVEELQLFVDYLMQDR